MNTDFPLAQLKVLTLSLLLITPSGQQHQPHYQVVKVQPFRGASKRAVDHLKQTGTQRLKIIRNNTWKTMLLTTQKYFIHKVKKEELCSNM